MRTDVPKPRENTKTTEDVPVVPASADQTEEEENDGCDTGIYPQRRRTVPGPHIGSCSYLVLLIVRVWALVCEEDSGGPVIPNLILQGDQVIINDKNVVLAVNIYYTLINKTSL